MDAQELKVLKNIDEHGCHILHVFEEASLPRFSYSIGIQKNFNHPELIVIGLKQELAQWIINEYCLRIKSGEQFETELLYSGFLDNFEIQFKTVNKNNYEKYFGWGLWLYKGNNFDVLQLIYPSIDGIWPWENEAPKDLMWSTPQLYAN
tara:strand:+ start:1173 stop:1619 length:447 start_codon:yes stop_codon:yes gene_type:complete